MANVEKDFAKGKPVYVGLDVHKRAWVVTVLCQGEEQYHAAIATDPQGLIRRLKTFGSSEIHTVYEAGLIMKPYLLVLCVALAMSAVECSKNDLSSTGGLIETFAVVDSLGHSRSAFKSSEPITVKYTLVNRSDGGFDWTSPMNYPLCRFVVRQADSAFGDSFYGLAFGAMPMRGTLAPGDSLKVTWQAIGMSGNLPLGEYTVTAEPMWHLPDPDGLSPQRLTFSITQ
jgi:hypothetical protein